MSVELRRDYKPTKGYVDNFTKYYVIEKCTLDI